MKKSNASSQLFVLMAAVLWGTTGSAQALAPENANPIVIGALRMLIGGTLLLLLPLIKGSFKNKFTLDKKAMFISAICVTLYQPLFFMGVSKTGVAFGTVLAIGSSPIFSGIIEYILGHKPSKKWILATTVSIVGCIFLFSGQDSIDINVLGSLLSLGAGLSYAAYAVVSQNLVQDSPLEIVNGCVFFISAIILLPILIVSDLSWVFTPRGLISTLHLGIVATALAYTLFTYGLVNVPASKAVALSLAEPLTATLLGLIVLKEKITFISTLGVLLLFFGLILNSRPEKGEESTIEKDVL